MAKTTVFLLLLISVGAFGWGVEQRRSFLDKMSFTTGLLLIVPQDAANAVLSSKYCAAGVGDGCEDRSEGNEYIKSLQEKSALNREANLKEATRAYQVKNYPDFFGSYGKFMVMKEDGSFLVLSEEELTSFRKAGKIKLVKPTAFKGLSLDYTQKPIRMLVD